MLFSNRDLRKIIIPLLIEQTLAVTIGMLDSMMVASAGEAAVSGVSLVDTVNLLLIYIFSALAGGGSIVIAQFLGKEDYKRAKEASKQLVWVVFLVSFTVMTLTLIFRIPLLHLIFGSIAEDVMANAQIYFLFTAISYPFLGLFNAGASVFRAVGNSRISMLISVVMNVLNVAGNALLIFVFHMGAAGAAIATLFSRIVGAVIMLVLVRDKRRIVYVENLFHFRPNMALIKRICGIGIPNGLENGMFQFGKVITQSLISSFGTMQIAANAVANSLTSLQYIPGTTIGLTIVTVIGRCIGAEEKEQAKSYTKKLLGIAYALIIFISLILCVFSKQFTGFYHLSGESTKIAFQLLIFHCICVSTIWPLAFTLPNSFRAASDVKYTMVLSVCSMWVFRVGLSFVFSKMLHMEIYGVWLAMVVDWLFRALMFVIRYLRGTWLTKYKPLES